MTTKPASTEQSIEEPHGFPMTAPQDERIIDRLREAGLRELIRATDTDGEPKQTLWRYRFRVWPGRGRANGATLQERWSSENNGRTWKWEWSEWAAGIRPSADDSERKAVLAACGVEDTEDARP